MKQYRIVLNVARFYTPSHSTCLSFCVPSPFRVGVSSLLSFLFSFFALTTQAQIITTIAGNGIQGYSGDNGLAIHAEFAGVYGIIVDKFGNIYLADNYFSNIRKIDTAGYITTFAGCGLSNPFNGDGIMATDANIGVADVAVDDSGYVYITDGAHFRIRKINPVTGIITTVIGTGVNGFSGDNGPASAAQIGGVGGISIDKTGSIYLNDGDKRIRKINPAGIITTIAGNGSFGFSGDNGPATNAMIYLGSNTRVTADDIGNVYIPDNGNYRIRQIDTFGKITTIAGTGVFGFNGDGIPATMAQIQDATSIYKDRLGNIFFNDTYRIRKINPAGIISTFAGTGIMGYSGDHGPANAAQLSGASSICTDSTGVMFLADEGNYVLRKITATVLINNLNITNHNYINIIPNPNNGKFTINIYSKENEEIQIIIYNILGEILEKFNLYTNIPNEVQFNLPKGIYFLSAKTLLENYTQKIIIN